MPLLCVNDLRISFHTRRGVTRAVDGISFTLEPGRTLGIVGESGSGKSVTCHSLMRLLPMPPARIESGSARFDGVDLLHCDARRMRAIRGHRIGMVFQEPMTSLNPYMKIGAQVCEPLRLHLGMSARAAQTRAIALMEEVGIPEPARRFRSYANELSGGLRQRVMIAMALAADPALLIADEPTTALDVTVQAQILDLIKKLQQRHGIATIFVSHDLGVIAGLADEVLVMQNGAAVEQGTTDDVFYRTRHPYTRKLLESIPSEAKPTPAPAIDPDAAPFVDIRDLIVRYDAAAGLFGSQADAATAVDGVSLKLRRGEILGLVGESGSGKSSLARAIVRLVDIAHGSVCVGGLELQSLAGRSLGDARRDMQMIFQDPYSSLNPRMTVFDCLGEALRCRRRLPGKTLRERIAELMSAVELDAGAVHRYPHEFSGGQRQRIAIARALALEPALIIADEPVSALDVTVQAQILRLLLELNRDRGISMIFISHDLSVVRYVSDRTAVMYRGRIVEAGETEALFWDPQHPYTQSLLSSIPIPDPERERRRVRIPWPG